MLDASGGLLSGWMSDAAFREALREEAAGPADSATEPPAEPETDADAPAEATTAADAAPPTKERKTRYGTCPEGVRSTKQATLIEMMSRPEGTTVDQLAAALGWLPHTVRGAIAGAIKKKLGLTVTTERVRGGDGARGACTIYRIQPAKNPVQS